MKKERPGFEDELQFKYFLDKLHDSCSIRFWYWLSLNSKSEFDFCVCKLSGYRVYIDVVGYYFENDKLRLNTAHKDFKAKINAIPYEIKGNKIKRNGVSYLVFRYPKKSNVMPSNWYFLKIKEDLPKGNITMTKNRSRGLRTWRTVFADTGILRDKAKKEYPEYDKRLYF